MGKNRDYIHQNVQKSWAVKSVENSGRFSTADLATGLLPPRAAVAPPPYCWWSARRPAITHSSDIPDSVISGLYPDASTSRSTDPDVGRLRGKSCIKTDTYETHWLEVGVDWLLQINYRVVCVQRPFPGSLKPLEWTLKCLLHGSNGLGNSSVIKCPVHNERFSFSKKFFFRKFTNVFVSERTGKLRHCFWLCQINIDKCGERIQKWSPRSQWDHQREFASLPTGIKVNIILRSMTTENLWPIFHCCLGSNLQFQIRKNLTELLPWYVNTSSFLMQQKTLRF